MAMIHRRELIRINLIITIFISIQSCNGLVKERSGFYEIDIIDLSGEKIVFVASDICGVLKEENWIEISFCNYKIANEKLARTKSRFSSIKLFSKKKEYLALPMNMIQAEFPNCDYAFVVNDVGFCEIINNKLRLFKYPENNLNNNHRAK